MDIEWLWLLGAYLLTNIVSYILGSMLKEGQLDDAWAEGYKRCFEDFMKK